MKSWILSLVLGVAFFGPSVETPRIWIDRLDQVYVLKGESLTKYAPEGIEVFTASFNATGAPSELDVTNPLMPVLFYANTGNLVVLDNTLSAQHAGYDLFAETGRNVSAFCNATNGQFWLFDAGRFELVRVDQQFRELGATGPLFTLYEDFRAPDLMRVEGNRLYLLMKGEGIWVFDQFGTYLHRLKTPGVQGIGFRQGALHYFTEESVYRVDRLAPEDPVIFTCSPGERVLAIEAEGLVHSAADGWKRIALPQGP